MRDTLRIEEPPQPIDHQALVEKITRQFAEWMGIGETEPGSDEMYAG